MASQGPNNTHNAAQIPGQAQMRSDDLLNQPSDIHNQGQGTNILQDTGTQVKNVAQGAVDIGKGAAQGAVNLARGAAAGAANMASGAADAVKNTLGMNPADKTGTTNLPGNMGSAAGSNNPTSKDHPSNPSTRI
ncbi:unnamed protein product [Fraxinus pennsylvanica]|uniref:Late embryogenesis abundant protein n=1 Tax=Fraxinus pennsylvanica TaxID=56036 RepID=A0AAD2DXC1_9LAMI|nr:unnamed protein product [Fraxinus pennsylvanica]